jgi:6-phosphogluconolactonase (cycloisomerase 2 family)
MHRTLSLPLAFAPLAVALATLVACGGGDSTATPAPVTPTTPTTPTSNGSAAPGIYVTNANNSVTVFALDASGNAAPQRTLSGASTGLSLPIGIGVDHQGNLYVANRTGGTVNVYPSTASGNVAPTRSLVNAAMGSPQAIAIGAADDVYVVTCPNCGAGNGGDTGVFHFATNSSSSDYQLEGDNTGFTVPNGLGLDQSKNLYVGNAFGGNVAVFAPGASGNSLPIRSFTLNQNGNAQSTHVGTNSGANAIAVGMPGSGVQLYDTTASGAVNPAATLAPSADFPLSYPSEVYFDNSVTPPVVYVNDYGASAVYVIQTAGTAPNLTVASVRTIQGAATGLSAPLGITVVH